MAVLHKCPACGLELPADVLEGLCPSCLLQSGLENDYHSPLLNSPGGSQSHGPFIPATPADLARFFPHLEILELLGQGGMGAVYKARQTKLDRLVALKVLPPSLCKDAAFAERFTREARALARLCHPHIVAVHDFGEVEGLFYFVMEYVDGANLRHVLRTGRLTPVEALRVVPQICEALQYAHEEGIIHRDIKPENILLDQKGRVKVADFGLAKLVGPTPGTFTLTGSRQVVGTPHYMAPEQMEKPQSVDHRADIYSLGVVFYEMLTGELPLGRFAPPSHKAAVDGRLDDVVLRALAKEPEQRFQRVSEVKSSLEGVADHRASASAGRGPTSARISIPFWVAERGTLNAPGTGGCGLLHWDGCSLHLEMELQETSAPGIMGRCVKTTTLRREKQITLEELYSIRFVNHWVFGKLLLRGTRLNALAEIPGNVAGQVRLWLNRRDRPDAERLVAELNARLGRGTVPMPAAAPPVEEVPPAPTGADVPASRGFLAQRARSFVQKARYWMLDSLAVAREPMVPPAPPTPVQVSNQPAPGQLRQLLGLTVGSSVFWAILLCLSGLATLFLPWSYAYSHLLDRYEYDYPHFRWSYRTPDGAELTLPNNISPAQIFRQVPGLRGGRAGFLYPAGIAVACVFGGLALILIATSAFGSPRVWRALVLFPGGVAVLLIVSVFLSELPQAPHTEAHFGGISEYQARRLGLTSVELSEALDQLMPYLDLWPDAGPFVALGLAAGLLLLGSLQVRGLLRPWQRHGENTC